MYAVTRPFYSLYLYTICVPCNTSNERWAHRICVMEVFTFCARNQHQNHSLNARQNVRRDSRVLSRNVSTLNSLEMLLQWKQQTINNNKCIQLSLLCYQSSIAVLIGISCQHDRTVISGDRHIQSVHFRLCWDIIETLLRLYWDSIATLLWLHWICIKSPLNHCIKSLYQISVANRCIKSLFRITVSNHCIESVDWISGLNGSIK